LHPQDEQAWLEDRPLGEITSMLQPYPSDHLNAYPIDPAIKNPRDKDPQLLYPTGNRINQEFSYEIHHELKLEGMGSTTARKRKNQDQQGTLF